MFLPARSALIAAFVRRLTVLTPSCHGRAEQNVTATNVKLLAGINSNYGDVANIDMSTISTSGVKSICDTFQGRRTMIGLQTLLRG